MPEKAQRSVDVGAADKKKKKGIQDSTVLLCLGTLKGVSTHVYA